jgi:hypothetical protein
MSDFKLLITYFHESQNIGLLIWHTFYLERFLFYNLTEFDSQNSTVEFGLTQDQIRI